MDKSNEGFEPIAKSVAQMIIEYIEGGIRSGQKWSNGLDVVIESRLIRLLGPALTDLHTQIESQSAEIARLREAIEGSIYFMDEQKFDGLYRLLHEALAPQPGAAAEGAG